MNKFWQGPVLLFLGRQVMCVNKEYTQRPKKKAWEVEGKTLRGKQLLKQSNTGEGDTLTSCMCCHGYQSPV